MTHKGQPEEAASGSCAHMGGGWLCGSALNPLAGLPGSKSYSAKSNAGACFPGTRCAEKMLCSTSFRPAPVCRSAAASASAHKKATSFSIPNQHAFVGARRSAGPSLSVRKDCAPARVSIRQPPDGHHGPVLRQVEPEQPHALTQSLSPKLGSCPLHRFR
eukprot:3854103-Rhodomonas_salina.2